MTRVLGTAPIRVLDSSCTRGMSWGGTFTITSVSPPSSWLTRVLDSAAAVNESRSMAAGSRQ